MTLFVLWLRKTSLRKRVNLVNIGITCSIVKKNHLSRQNSILRDIYPNMVVKEPAFGDPNAIHRQNRFKVIFQEYIFCKKKTITGTISAFLMIQLNSLRICLKLIWTLFKIKHTFRLIQKTNLRTCFIFLFSKKVCTCLSLKV